LVVEGFQRSSYGLPIARFTVRGTSLQMDKLDVHVCRDSKVLSNDE